MPEPQATTRSRRELLFTLYDAANSGNAELWGASMTDDCVVEYPQSGERFIGRENNEAVIRNYPGEMQVDMSDAALYVGDEGHYVLTPMFTTVKVDGEGETLVASVKTRYPDGTDWYIISIAHFRGDKIDKQVLYFAPVFEAPDWREPYREPMKL